MYRNEEYSIGALRNIFLISQSI